MVRGGVAKESPKGQCGGDSKSVKRRVLGGWGVKTGHGAISGRRTADKIAHNYQNAASCNIWDDYYWLVWLSIETYFASPDVTLEQFISTLYGVRHAVYAEETGRDVEKRCYYARPGPFER